MGVGARGRLGPLLSSLTLLGVEGCLGICGPAPPPMMLSILKLLTFPPGLGDIASPGDIALRCGE